MKRLILLMLVLMPLAAFAKAQAQVLPSSGKKYPAGTHFIGKCQAPRTPPELKNEGFDDNGVPKGPVLHYHMDVTESVFWSISNDGSQDKHMGDAVAKSWTTEELIANQLTCKTVDPYQKEPFTIDWPGHYQMIVKRHQQDQTYDPKTMNLSGWSIDEGSTKDDVEKIDFFVVDCGSRNTQQISNGQSCQLSDRALRAAFDQEFASQKLDTPGCYVSTQAKNSQLMDFQIRLGANHNLLPTQDAARQAAENGEGQQEGSREMLVGSVQLVGDQIRVVVRIIDVETGQVKSTGKGDAAGCPNGLDQALHAAMTSLNTPLRSSSGQ